MKKVKALTVDEVLENSTFEMGQGKLRMTVQVETFTEDEMKDIQLRVNKVLQLTRTERET